MEILKRDHFVCHRLYGHDKLENRAANAIHVYY